MTVTALLLHSLNTSVAFSSRTALSSSQVIDIHPFSQIGSGSFHYECFKNTLRFPDIFSENLFERAFRIYGIAVKMLSLNARQFASTGYSLIIASSGTFPNMTGSPFAVKKSAESIN